MTRPFLDTAFVPNHDYNDLLISLVQITSLFIYFISLLPTTSFGMCCRPEWQEWMYIYKSNEVDQAKHESSCVHTVCNEIQVKVNLQITAFFFYLHFPYLPNFF